MLSTLDDLQYGSNHESNSNRQGGMVDGCGIPAKSLACDNSQGTPHGHGLDPLEVVHSEWQGLCPHWPKFVLRESIHGICLLWLSGMKPSHTFCLDRGDHVLCFDTSVQRLESYLHVHSCGFGLFPRWSARHGLCWNESPNCTSTGNSLQSKARACG